MRQGGVGTRSVDGLPSGCEALRQASTGRRTRGRDKESDRGLEVYSPHHARPCLARGNSISR